MSAAPSQATQRQSFRVIQKQGPTFMRPIQLAKQFEDRPSTTPDNDMDWCALIRPVAMGVCVCTHRMQRHGQEGLFQTRQGIRGSSEYRPRIVRVSSSFLSLRNERSIRIGSFLCRISLDRSGESREHDEEVVEGIAKEFQDRPRIVRGSS